MRIDQPTEDQADRFPQAMIEGSSVYSWEELPEQLKDVMRAAASAINEWAQQQVSPLAGEVVPAADGEHFRYLPEQPFDPGRSQEPRG
jgi:hypothetical protein